MGLEPRVEKFGLPNGRTSRNIIVVIPGSDARRVVVGAHMDSNRLRQEPMTTLSAAPHCSSLPASCASGRSCRRSS